MRKTVYPFESQIGLEVQKPCSVVSATLTDLKLHNGQIANMANGVCVRAC